MEYVKLYYKKFWQHAKTPTRATPLSIGSDLYSAFAYCIPPKRGKATINTGIQLVIPSGYYGRIASKSGKEQDCSLHVGAGVIDPDYTGPIKVILYNFGDQPHNVNPGDSVAQIILEKAALPILEEVQELPLTSRENQGFGVLD